MNNSKLYFLLNLFIICILPFNGYAQQADVITLGVFHFSFPNLDAQQIDSEDQINVLSSQFQKEIELIVKKLTQFNPDIIIVEAHVKSQQRIDSLYQSYLKGNHLLRSNEIEQLGFRVAQKCGSRIHCADEWGAYTASIEELLENETSEQYLAFEKSFEDNPDSLLYYTDNNVFKQKGILAELIRLNNPEEVEKSLGNYLIGHFKHESLPGDYIGVDFETGRWFNRNLRIFRNIQRIPNSQGKRILIIFGAGHMNLLNYFLKCSPEYNLVNVNDYLK